MNAEGAAPAAVGLIVTIASGAATVSLLLFVQAAFSRATRKHRRAVATQTDRVQTRIELLQALSIQAQVLASELALEIAATAATAAKLGKEADEARRLEAFNKEAQEAAAAVLLRNDDLRRWPRRWANVGWFAAGVVASVLSTLFIHPLV